MTRWVHYWIPFSTLEVAGLVIGPIIGSPLHRVDHSRSMNGAVVCWLLVGLTADPSGVRVGSALDGLPAAGSMNGGLVC
jgi:hypothetical protein